MRRPTRVTTRDALQILHDSFTATDHRPYVVLVDMANVVDMSSDARQVFSSARNVLAAAMIGHSPLEQVLSAPFEKAVYPCEYFTDHQTAREWLSLMHDLLCGDPVEHTMSLTVDFDPFRQRKLSHQRGRGTFDAAPPSKPDREDE